MPDNAPKRWSISDVEDVVNEVARLYGKTQFNLPPHAVKVILWPTDKFLVRITSGPSAIIRMGILPGRIEDGPEHPQTRKFNRLMRDAIEYVWRKKLWQSVELELVSRSLYRDEQMRRYRRERFRFREELIPGTLGAEEVSISTFTRVEVVHRETKLREVVEFERGKGNEHTAREVAIDRLARRVNEIRQPENPFELSNDDPNWIALTN